MLERAQKERLRRRIYWVGATMFAALLSSVMLEMWFVSFSYQHHKTAVISILRLQAEAIADNSGAYIAAITSHLGWTVQRPWSAGALDHDQRLFDAQRLLRQVPAITGLVLAWDSLGLCPPGLSSFQAPCVILCIAARPLAGSQNTPRQRRHTQFFA
jgi:hypothetical protein